MSEAQQQTAVVKKDAASVEYIPYGGQDKIKMTISIIQNLIAVKTKSGKTCSERDAVKFMAMCQAKRMNPFEGDCFLIGYDTRDGASFALVTAHQTYLKRAELHPEFDGMKSGLIVDEDGTLKDLEGDFFIDGQKIMGGWATVYFKNRKQPMHKRLRLERFRKPFGIWQEDPAGMICKCAEADALRSSFPTMLGGLYLREEMVGPDPEISKPDFSAPKAKTLFTVPGGQGQLPEPSPESLVQEFKQEPEEQPIKPADTDLQVVRKACAARKIKEADLLAYLGETGFGEYGTLEEMAMSSSKSLNMVVTEWPNIADQIIQRLGGGK